MNSPKLLDPPLQGFMDFAGLRRFISHESYKNTFALIEQFDLTPRHPFDMNLSN